MAALVVPQQSVNDLWADAAAQLSNDDKLNINFNRPDKLNILAELHADAERSKQRSLESRWKYTRKSGETVIIRDVFQKIVRWVEMFKQVGDVAVQYDPGHAALPWAGIRFLLQIAVNDSTKLALVVEDLASIAELICRYAVTEALYIHGILKANTGLKRAVVKLYASILSYLSKAKQYFEQGTAKRIIKSVALVETQFDSGLEDIRTAEGDIGRWIALVDRNDSVDTHTELMRLLADMNVPLRRIDDSLKNIQDNLQASRRAEVVRWLSPEPYIQHHKQARQGVLAGTGQWLLSNPVFEEWKDESASSILWLHGIAGSGKSKLVSIVIEDALKSFKAGNSPQPVFFYCSRNPAEPARSDPKLILASLARQLSSLATGKPLLKPVIDLFEKEEAEGFASGQLQMEESCQLIMQLIELYPQTTVIIDAMDECDPTTRLELLQALEHILQKSSSLVKVFVSSRDDQDIVLRLSDYPNLEINSQRNSDDIAQFVKEEAERLIQARKLLRYSSSQTEMKKLVIDKVIEGATGMFRWASMQLQHLCLFTLDADIQNALGRLPPDLHTLYTDIYDILSTKPGKLQATIFKNVLHWLLCAQRTLHTNEFLAAVSMNPKGGSDVVSISKDVVLEICNNFVVFDSELETFRFAHLSVREFLERRPEYSESTTNRLIAEVSGLCCLQIETSQLRSCFSNLVDIYWAVHCKSSGNGRNLGTLKIALKHILFHDVDDTSSLILWSVRLQVYFRGYMDWEIKKQLEHAVMTADLASSAGLFVSCAFDFEEQIEDILGRKMLTTNYINRHGRSPLYVAARNGSYATLARLIAQDEFETDITVEVVEAAAENSNNGKELMTLLLDRRGADVTITEEVVKAAAGNNGNGKEVMTLLLDRRGADVKITEEVLVATVGRFDKDVVALLLNQRGTDVTITEEVVKAAARNWYNGKEVMTLLLHRRGADIPITEEVLVAIVRRFDKDVVALLLNQPGADAKITEEVVKAAAENNGSGKEVMTLLLDRRGADVKITEEVVKAAAGNWYNGKEVMTLLLDRRGADVTITEEVVKAAARNWDKEVITLLLDRRGADVTITEEVLKAAAENNGSGKEVMTLLLDRRRADVTITEEVMNAAARNLYSGKEVTALLLNRLGADTPITEEVVKAAAGNRDNGKEVMTLLLNRRAAGT